MAAIGVTSVVWLQDPFNLGLVSQKIGRAATSVQQEYRTASKCLGSLMSFCVPCWMDVAAQPILVTPSHGGMDVAARQVLSHQATAILQGCVCATDASASPTSRTVGARRAVTGTLSGAPPRRRNGGAPRGETRAESVMRGGRIVRACLLS